MAGDLPVAQAMQAKAIVDLLLSCGHGGQLIERRVAVLLRLVEKIVRHVHRHVVNLDPLAGEITREHVHDVAHAAREPITEQRNSQTFSPSLRWQKLSPACPAPATAPTCAAYPRRPGFGATQQSPQPSRPRRPRCAR